MTGPPVPVLCTWCRDPRNGPVEIMAVRDGPGIRIVEVPPERVQPGDICADCPRCGKPKCVRVLRPAA